MLVLDIAHLFSFFVFPFFPGHSFACLHSVRFNNQLDPDAPRVSLTLYIYLTVLHNEKGISCA